MEIKVLDTKGKSSANMTLDKNVFGIEPNEAILAQYVRVFTTNQRQGTSKVKGRSEVRGGGRKPWRQKGTGRARHGSIRSPIWVGGGVAHGPKPKNWLLKMPKGMRKVAMRSALSLSAAKNEIFVLEEIEFKKPNTKELSTILKNIKAGGKILIVLFEKDENIIKSASNLKKVNVSLYENLNVYDLLNANSVVFEKKALEEITKKYKK